MAADAWQQNIYGNLIIESNKSDTVSDLAGGEAFSLKGVNKDGHRFILAHHEGGITRCETEQTLQIDAGAKKASNGGTAMQVTAHTGNLSLTAVKDHVLIKASKTITLDANDIIIKGTNTIQIGGDDVGDTKEIKLIAEKIDVYGPAGDQDLLDHLKLSSFMSSVSGKLSFVSDTALGMTKSFSKDALIGAAARVGGTAVGGPVGGIVAQEAAKRIV